MSTNAATTRQIEAAELRAAANWLEGITRGWPEDPITALVDLAIWLLREAQKEKEDD